MLQLPIPLSPTPRAGRDSSDSSDSPEDRAEEVNALERLPDSTLDEAGWQVLLTQIDQEEGGP